MRLAAAFALAVAVAAGSLAACKRSTAAGPKAPTVSAITVTLAPRPVGLRWVETDDSRMEVELRHGARTAWVGTRRHHRTELEILEVDAAGVVTKLAVTYREREDEDSGPEPGATQAKRSALAGKAYVVGVVDGKVTATRAEGGRVSDAELRELTADHDDVGTVPAMDEILARTWQLGVTVDLTADELSRLAAGTRADAPRMTFASFTLREVRGDEAELAMRTRMQSSGRTSMTIDANGAVVIDLRTGWPRSVSLGGAVNGTIAGMPISGNIKSTQVMTVLAPGTAPPP